MFLVHQVAPFHLAQLMKTNWTDVFVAKRSRYSLHQSKDVLQCVCIAHRRRAPLICYRFPYVGADLHKRKPALQPGISEHCQSAMRDHGYGLVYHAIWLFTSPVFAGYSFQPIHRRRAHAEYAWVPGSAPRWLPVQRRSPTQALSGPSVQ